MNPHIYIQSAKQISIQQPLSEVWMESPIIRHEPFVHSIEANYRDYVSPIEARRMSPIVKRALATTLEVIKETGITHPDAIVTGTSSGCLDCTEKFLADVVENREQWLKPTYFIQSTHNTVGSTLGIYTKSHGYNATYSHGCTSFELALKDAYIQIQLGRIVHALVGGYEEMVDNYFELLRTTEYVGVANMCPCSEMSVSLLLNTQTCAEYLCELIGVVVCHKVTIEKVEYEMQRLLQKANLNFQDIDAVLTGVNGNPANDLVYKHLTSTLFADKPLLRYKHLFGETFTVSACGLYAAAHCLNKGVFPQNMFYRNESTPHSRLHVILMLNQQNGEDFSLILLRK